MSFEAPRFAKRALAAGFAAAVAITPITVAISDVVASPSSYAAPVASTPATKAGTWLASQFTNNTYYTSTWTGAADVSGTADAVLGLLASGVGQETAKNADAWLKTKAAGLTSPGQIARLSIVASAMGDNPSSYGGVNLTAKVQAAVAAKGGDLGDPYSDALAVIALHRAGVGVPESLVTGLEKRQAASGVFFFGTVGGTDYFEDGDSTGLALAALQQLPGTGASVSKATAWAKANRKAAGYWDSFSPVNTTGLVGSALRAGGSDVSASVTWMIGQQQKAGGSGLPAALNDTTPDAYATAQGLLLLGGKTLATVKLTSSGPTTKPTPTSTPSASGSASAPTSPSASATSSTPPSQSASASTSPSATRTSTATATSTATSTATKTSSATPSAISTTSSTVTVTVPTATSTQSSSALPLPATGGNGPTNAPGAGSDAWTWFAVGAAAIVGLGSVGVVIARRRSA